MSLRRKQGTLERLFGKLSDQRPSSPEPEIDIRSLTDEQVDRMQYLTRKMLGKGLSPEDLPTEERDDLEKLMAQCTTGATDSCERS